MKKLQRLTKSLKASNVLSNKEAFYIKGGEEITSTCWSYTDTCNEGVGDHRYTRSVDGKVKVDEVTDCQHSNCVNG